MAASWYWPTDVLCTTNDRAGIEGMIDALCRGVGTPDTLLGDAGYAGETIVTALRARGIDPLITIARGDAARNYDFRPPPEHPKPPPNITAPWRLDMQQKLQTEDAKAKYPKTKIHCRAGLWHHQIRPRLHPLPPARHRQCQNRMDPGCTGLQLQKAGKAQHRMKTANRKITQIVPNPTDC